MVTVYSDKPSHTSIHTAVVETEGEIYEEDFCSMHQAERFLEKFPEDEYDIEAKRIETYEVVVLKLKQVKEIK